MDQIKFDEKGYLIPQKVNYTIKRNEMDEVSIDIYIKNECNFKIEYNNEGELLFKQKTKIIQKVK